MKLDEVFRLLDEDTPHWMAEDWDNVGPIVVPDNQMSVRRLLLTIDLTPEVLAEAVKKKAELIIGYHPPIFSGLKRLRCDSDQDPIPATALHAMRRGIAIYSPHTALDAVSGGVSDWLCNGLGKGTRVGIKPCVQSRPNEYAIAVYVPKSGASQMRRALSDAGAGQIGAYSACSFTSVGIGRFTAMAGSQPRIGMRGQEEAVEEVRIETVCLKSNIERVCQAIKTHHPYEEPAWQIYPLMAKPGPGDVPYRAAHGRRVALSRPVTLATLVKRLKAHLGLKQLRVAAPERVRRGHEKLIEICVCPGAGGSVFADISAQCFLTGEMRHHDVLKKIAQGSTVILSEHTATERGYLPIYQARLKTLLGTRVSVLISQSDQALIRTV